MPKPTVVDEFIVALGLDPAGFNKGRKAAADDLLRLREDSRRTGNEIETHAKRGAAMFRTFRNEVVSVGLALAGATGLKAFVGDIVNTDAATGRLARNIGMATADLSAWQGAIQRVGGQASEADAALSAMAKAYQTFQLTGTTGNDADFQGLGVSARDLANPAEALLKIAEASERLSQPEFAARLGRLGFTQAQITLLAKGRGELTALIAEQKTLGVTTDEDARKAAELEDALAKLSARIRGEFRPYVYQAVDGLMKFDEQVGIANVAIPIMAGAMGALALATAAATWPWLALAAAIGAAVAAYQSWANRGDKSTGEWAAEKLRGARAWIDTKLGIRNGGEETVAGYNEGRDAMGDPLKGAANDNGKGGSDIVAFFKSRGYSDAQARGITAGIMAESGGNHRAINRTSGAMGLGQHLGSRKAELLRRYGPNPTRQQQLEFLDWELKGGDHGGAAVRAQTSAGGTLDAYIKKFMRPAQGAETSGDIRRGNAWLNGGRAAGAGGGTVTNQTTVGTINVYTAATDATGIARDLPGAIQKRGIAAQATGGLN